MTAKFFAILTNQGAAKLANAASLGTKLNLTQMALGDANGVLPTPDAAQTQLINQKRIAPLNRLSVDPNNTNQIIAEQVIPENEGGFWIREIGLYDDDSVLIAIANCPETYKPLLQEGSGRTQTIRMALIVSSTAAVTLKIDPSVVLATRQYADDLMNNHVKAANPHTQYAPLASPVFSGVAKAPTPDKNSNDKQVATTEFVQMLNAELVSGELARKQPLNDTLTNLSGKDVAGILQFLGLGNAKYVTNRGSNANGTWVIWSDGAVELMGYTPTINNGLATVTFPIELPAISHYISIAERLLGDTGVSDNTTHTSMVIDTLTTKAGFKARCIMSATGTPSSNGFSWRVYHAPI